MRIASLSCVGSNHIMIIIEQHVWCLTSGPARSERCVEGCLGFECPKVTVIVPPECENIWEIGARQIERDQALGAVNVKLVCEQEEASI